MSDQDKRVSAESAAESAAESPCPMVVCPNCGKDTPAASNRSDRIVSYRCDVCGYQWSSEPEPAGGEGKPAKRDSDSELPPIPAIDAPGG
jgi:transposase-like protein